MVNYHQWVTRQHAGTRESHHFPDLFPHFWFVTMNLTITAKRLGLHKWTAVRAKMSIGEKSFALRTEPAFQGMVFFSAVQRIIRATTCFSRSLLSAAMKECSIHESSSRTVLIFVKKYVYLKRIKKMIKIRNGKLDIRTMAIMSMADAGSRMQVWSLASWPVPSQSCPDAFGINSFQETSGESVRTLWQSKMRIKAKTG